MKLTKTKAAKLGKGLEPFLNYKPGPLDAYVHEKEPKAEERGHSIRYVTHRSREIEIHTHYKIFIDGEPLDLHVMAGDDGRVHCHALPNYGFRSTVDLVRQLLDTFSRATPKDELSFRPRSARAKKGVSKRARAKRKL